eukprot:jgi/Picre1/30504/NNA_005867.t1
MGNPIKSRAKEAEMRPKAAESLRKLCNDFIAAAQGGNPKYAHLTEEELGKVTHECQDALAWLEEKEKVQASCQPFDDPVLLAEDITKRAETVSVFCTPILNKPPPALQQKKKKKSQRTWRLRQPRQMMERNRPLPWKKTQRQMSDSYNNNNNIDTLKFNLHIICLELLKKHKKRCARTQDTSARLACRVRAKEWRKGQTVTMNGAHITPKKGVRSGFIKPDSELKGLLHRIYTEGNDSDESGIHGDGFSNDDTCCERVQRTLLTAPVRGIPVYVMLPLDTVWLAETEEGILSDSNQLKSVLMRENGIEVGLEMLRASGVEGVMVDVWWGIAEHQGPGLYDFSAYRRLFEKVASKGLKVQAVMSFHAAGGNVGDTCTIPLPPWVYDAAEMDPDIFYTDVDGHRNPEYISLGCDEEPCFLMGETITEITVGLGPAGELRYPSYPEGDGRWRFPGVGQFQCFDKYMLERLQHAATEYGRPEWGHGGPMMLVTITQENGKQDSLEMTLEVLRRNMEVFLEMVLRGINSTC